MDAPRVWYVNVFVRDLERSIAFYRDVLDLTPQYADPAFGYASFEAGPIRIGLAAVPEGSENAHLAGRHTGVGLGVTDLARSHAVLAERGVRFTAAPEKQPWGGFMALFEDPDGNVFYLDQLREEQS